MPIEGYNLSQKLRTGFINLDMATARAVGSTAGESWANATAAVGTPGGGVLSSATAPRLTAVSTAVRVMVLDWTSASLVPVQFSPIVLPPDFTSVSSATLNVLIGRAAAASSDQAPAFNFTLYASTSASAAAISLSALTASSAAALVTSAVISTVQIPNGYPNVLTAVCAPLSSQDNLKLYGAWIEYVRAQRG